MKLLEGTKGYRVGAETLENRKDTWGRDLNTVNTVQEGEAEMVVG